MDVTCFLPDCIVVHDEQNWLWIQTENIVRWRQVYHPVEGSTLGK
jgi:hypothetical protein